MGNSVPVILTHYREIVTPAAAAAFWNLTPAGIVPGNVLPLERPAKSTGTRRTKSA